MFFHSSNTSGPYNEEALQTIGKFQMATIEKFMGKYVKNVDDEDEMVLAMIAIKKVNPKITTYFYMNAIRDRLEMSRMHRELQQHPDYYLRDSNGTQVKDKGGFNIIDLSKLEVRQWWQNCGNKIC